MGKNKLQNNLRSFFVQELLDEKSNNNLDDNEFEKLLELGLNSLKHDK